MAATIETKLYVTNFPSSTTRQQLQQFFSRFGRVQECAIMWNSYAFVHYASMEEARRALDQSNGAMFLNRKLIVQLSTSRFRPQPKDSSITSQPPSQLLHNLMIMGGSPSPIGYSHLSNGNGTINYPPLPPTQQQPPTQPSRQFPTEFNYDLVTSASVYNNSKSFPTGLHQHSSPSPPSDSIPNNFFNNNSYRPPSPFYTSISSQELTNGGAFYASYGNSTTVPLSVNKTNPIKSNKIVKTDIGMNGEIPKLYCTNLPDNCKANDLQRLFSPFGLIVDCVILWDYYAFVTFKTFIEAERAMNTLNGQVWKDRRLIVEWSRASGRRQQQPPPPPPVPQPSSSPTPRYGSFCSDVSTPSSPRTRPSTLLSSHPSASNGQQFYSNNNNTNSPKMLSPLLPSPLKPPSPPHHSFNHNLALMSMLQQQHPYGNYPNGNNGTIESLNNNNNDNQPIFDSLTNSSSSTHRLDLSPFIETTNPNSNNLFSPTSELHTSPSPVPVSNDVYQPSDIATLLEPTSDMPVNKSNNNNSDGRNPGSSTTHHPTCSSSATAALFQENLLSSLFGSCKLFPFDEQSSSRYQQHLLPPSPLLTTAPDSGHHPLYYGLNTSWH